MVYLIGAGPGDPRLLTLRAVECLKKADVVLYDGLANPAILKWASDSATSICVGKHGQSKIWSQSEINQSIIEHAQLGRIVARLKGGDPAIFARTAEELDRLVEHGIPFEVVPGVTAALAAASYTGIPITHRDWAGAVALVTGQSQAIDGGEEAEEAMDWRALAQFPGTLVFYMGVTSAGAWSQKLIDAGKPPATPVALIRRCTWPDQEVIHCTLSEIVQTIASRPKFRPPVITIVGDVVRYGPQFDWFSLRPLHGKTILLGRPRHQSQAWIDRLEELGAVVLTQPAVEIKPLEDWHALDRAIDSVRELDWLIWTSANGVHAFMQRLIQMGRDARWLGGVRLACVGPSTADALKQYCLQADCIPEDRFEAEGLVEELSARVVGHRCLWVRGSRGRDVLIEGLVEAGGHVESVVAYRSEDVESADPAVLKQVELGSVDYVLVTSSAMARAMGQMFGERLKRADWIGWSPLTSATIRELGYQVSIESKSATLESLIEALIEASSCRSDRSLGGETDRSLGRETDRSLGRETDTSFG